MACSLLQPLCVDHGLPGCAWAVSNPVMVIGLLVHLPGTAVSSEGQSTTASE